MIINFEKLFSNGIMNFSIIICYLHYFIHYKDSLSKSIIIYPWIEINSDVFLKKGLYVIKIYKGVVYYVGYLF